MQGRQPAAKAAASACDALTGHSWHLRRERRWGEVKSNLKGRYDGTGRGKGPSLQIVPHLLTNPDRSMACGGYFSTSLLLSTVTHYGVNSKNVSSSRNN